MKCYWFFSISFSSREESTENEKFNRAWKRCCGVGWGGLSREIHNCRFHAFTEKETLRRIILNNLKLKKNLCNRDHMSQKRLCSGPFSSICVEKLKWIGNKMRFESRFKNIFTCFLSHKRRGLPAKPILTASCLPACWQMFA